VQRGAVAKIKKNIHLLTAASNVPAGSVFSVVEKYGEEASCAIERRR
jgi:hypothetical protein